MQVLSRRPGTKRPGRRTFSLHTARLHEEIMNRSFIRSILLRTSQQGIIAR